MSNYVLDKSYRVAPESGIGAGLVVVRGADDGECDLPAGAHAGAVLGITTHAQTRLGRYIGVRRLGIASAVAAGAIARGARVAVADSQGRVVEAANPVFTGGSTGANNAIRIEWLHRETFCAALTIDLDASASDQSFDWSFTNGSLRILLATDAGGAVAQTAAQLIAAVAGDETLSKLISVTNTGGSTGAGDAPSGVLVAANITQLANIIGIAEEAATQEGDLIDILLTP